MLQTLFHIPHSFLGIPVFGFGWALGIWLVASLFLIGSQARRHGFTTEVQSYLYVLAVLGGTILWVLPGMEERDGPDGEILGLAIRSYGLFMLLGVVGGVGLAAWRAKLMGLDPEIIFSLAMVLFVTGIIGARLVYVVQYWNTQFAPTSSALEEDMWKAIGQALLKVVNIPGGGLVVYGSLIGGLLGLLIFCRVWELSPLAVADLIAPSFMIGLCLGRIGCLMNGCCYGGLCDQPWAIQFPMKEAARHSAPLSPPYSHQLAVGQLHGIRMAPTDDNLAIRVVEVLPQGPAADSGLKAGDVIVAIRSEKLDKPVPSQTGGPPQPPDAFRRAQVLFQSSPPDIEVTLKDGRVIGWTVVNEAQEKGYPAWTLPVHPTQIYAAINAGLMCLLLLAVYPYRRHDGEVLSLLLVLYGISRILEESIRDDESKSFFLGMTISQNISVVMIVGAVALWLYVTLRKEPLALPIEPKPAAS